MEETGQRLALLKALGDNTRYAIYLELARSPAPRSTAEVAESLELHPNTVRPHLERMREVGLLAVETDGRGGVGRPQHLYSLAPDAPSLGLEPPPMPLLARLLAGVAASAGVSPDEAAEVGRQQGRQAATGARAHPEADDDDSMATCTQALAAELTRLGFDPAVAGDDDAVSIAFTHCPYSDLAKIHPEIVCHLHRGMVEGFVEASRGAGVEQFHTLLARSPCQVDLSRV
ncbi:MAG TPA: helix-turn-helix domain-containing protein [Acidimicrobiales bacterium]|nr:helix-turn-helix domain-containing protein [Acidimicrobiales bacterium]